MLRRIKNVLVVGLPNYARIENVVAKATGGDELMNIRDYWQRIGRLYDHVDQAINGTVEWHGEIIAKPDGKRLPATLVMLAIIVIARDQRVDGLLRAGTQYDPKTLPPA